MLVQNGMEHIFPPLKCTVTWLYIYIVNVLGH